METATAPPRSKPRLRGVVHLIAAVGALPAVAVLVLHARSDASLGAAVYGASLVALLSASAVYHTFWWSPRIRDLLKRIDHSMIYVLIAGSYTPFCLELGEAASILLPLVWAAALLGVIKAVVWTNAPRWVTAGSYVLFGWAAVPFGADFYATLDPAALALLLGGGLIYTLGAVIYTRKWPNPAPGIFGYHEVFHVLVVVASGIHYAGVWITVT